jgi:hypothetical protein
MDWNSPTQFPPTQNIQLEEEYYIPAQGQTRPHHAPLTHASYPPATQPLYRTYHNISQNPAGQQSTRTLSLGQNGTNGNVYDSNPSGVYDTSMSRAAYNQNPAFYHSPALPYRQHQPEAQIISSPGLSGPLTINGTSDGGLTPPFVSSPMSAPIGFGSQEPPQGLAQGQSRYHTEMRSQQMYNFQSPPTSGSNLNPENLAQGQELGPQSKRQRGLDEDEDYVPGIDVGMEHEGNAGDNKDAKPKPLGACARCKLLKVKCEFKTMEDPCKRCMNAGKECFIPGRKKRRTPPKREHLLTQIREQAMEIQRLMAQLEVSKRQRQPHSKTHTPAHRPSSSADLLSPLDATSGESSDHTPKPDVEEWIAKARESIEAFGEFIGAGGVEMTKDFLVDQDPENSGGSDDDDAYEIAIEDEEGEAAALEELLADSAGTDNDGGYQGRSSSSNISGHSGGSGGPKKKLSNGQASPKLVIIPGEAAPFGLIASLALKTRRRRSSGSVDDEDDVGVANEDFFRSPTPESARMLSGPKQTPHILARGVVTPDEAEKLFKIYFDSMGLSVSLLDPVLYTAQKTCYRSPFLFTVICAIASRYYTEKPGLYADLMHYAQLAAGTALISGQKSIEVCQAYILLSLYPVPARRWEDDRGWLYLGMAIRVATDLNLYLPNTAKPVNEQHAREMLNRTRVWLNCFNLDRSTGSQYGKMPIIENSDYIANHSEDWWENSEFNMNNFDIHTCGYNAELRVMSAFRKRIYSDPNHPTGLNKNLDFELIATETDDELKSLGDHWFSRIEQTDQTDPHGRFRTGLLKLAYSYARLVALSLGFKHAFGKNNTDENPFLTRCLSAAFDVVNTYVNDVGRPAQRVYLRHGPEAQSVFVTFACSFLVKLLQPKFTVYLTREKRLEIRSLVQNVADLLGSPEVAIDERHGPKLYSRFLKGLLATPLATSVDSLSPRMNTNSLPQQRTTRRQKSGSGLSPDSEQSFEFIQHNGSVQTSPSTSKSLLSPLPDSAFDSFPPVTGGITPSLTVQTQFSSRPSSSKQLQYATPTDMSEWFGAPLPFDDELLQSMQSVQDSVWGQDVSLSGFNWLSNIQSSSEDTYMKPSDTMNDMFPDYFNLKTPPP